MWQRFLNRGSVKQSCFLRAENTLSQRHISVICGTSFFDVAVRITD